MTATYKKGITAEITEGFTVSGFDSETVGNKMITVNYKGYEVTFMVTVTEPMRCEHMETATQYNTLEEALLFATKGTIKLLMDTTADTVMLKPGVTLDLNGYTLTADSVIVFNSATILDGGTACTGGGLLKVAEENLGFTGRLEGISSHAVCLIEK